MNKEIVIKNHTISSLKTTICVPVVSVKREDVISDVKNCINNGVELIELRADFFDCIKDKEELKSLLQEVADICKDTILLFTIRSQKEGGQIQLSDDELTEILLYVSSLKLVDIIDVEYFAISGSKKMISELKSDNTYVIASHHNFECTYEGSKIVELYEQMADSEADILKMAMMPQNNQDTLRNLFNVSMLSSRFPDKLYIGISMGEYGKLSRVCGGAYGSCITFSSLKEASAPGQISYNDMKTILSIIE